MKIEVGETLVYPHHGAVTITALETRTVKGEEKQFMTLNVHAAIPATTRRIATTRRARRARVSSALEGTLTWHSVRHRLAIFLPQASGGGSPDTPADPVGVEV